MTLDRALLAATTPDMFKGADAESFGRLKQAVRLCRYGGDCYAYVMLALGQLDLVVEASLSTYDIAPLIPIIEKAGGVVSTWEGGDASVGGRVAACGDPQLLPAVLELLNG
jgi:myo-inositol-1(or 4)-monophosphatase